MPAVEINYLAVLVAAIVNMIVGAVWYSTSVFGRTWMSLVGKSDQDLKKGAQTAYLGAAIASLIAAYVLAHFVDYVEAKTISAGFQTGFWVWLGFVATTTGTNYLFEGRRKKLFAINVGYNLISLLIMGAILAVWV